MAIAGDIEVTRTTPRNAAASNLQRDRINRLLDITAFHECISWVLNMAKLLVQRPSDISQNSETFKAFAIIMQSSREISLWPSRQLRTASSENPRRLAIEDMLL
ncbi:MAG: hypothetical protein M3Y27_10770 [Acidobacteriota bacterium]|nr:hypothetical protein [Acidobacteriota bacterium]